MKFKTFVTLSAVTLVLVMVILFSGIMVDMFDISLYHNYAKMIFDGKIPYVDFFIEYPQIALIPILLPYFLSSGNVDTYIMWHFITCTALYMVILYLVYEITLKVYRREIRAIVASFMCATAFSAIYFVLTKYDVYPALLILFSIYLYICREDIRSAYLVSVIGFFTKWISAIQIPFFILRDYKKKEILKYVLFAFVLAALIISPFLIVALRHGDISNLILTYTYHSTRSSQTASLPYLMDHLTNSNVFSYISNIVLVISLCAICYLYYKNNKTDHTTIQFITLAVFVFMFLNKVASPQYILWITPLLAIIFSGKFKAILYFYTMQALMFIEFPLLWGVIADNTHYILPTAATYFFMMKYLIWAIMILKVIEA